MNDRTMNTLSSIENCGLFQPSLLKTGLIYSTADEQVGELKQINYNFQSMISVIKVDNL